MPRRFLPLLFLPLFALPMAANATSDTALSAACAKRADMLAQLSVKYSEEPVAIGLATNGTIVEILASGNGGSFTILYTMPNGVTCMMAAGQNWEMIDPVVSDANA